MCGYAIGDNVLGPAVTAPLTLAIPVCAYESSMIKDFRVGTTQ
jgi:hypothetical protein